MSITVKVLKRKSDIPLPQYETPSSAGMDARAEIAEDVVIQPLKRKLIPTGLKVSIPPGYTLDVDSRSGLAVKNGIFVLNAPGIVDADYRGDIGVIVANLGEEPFTIKRGDRICQLLLRKVERVVWEEVEELDATHRGQGGFGSTGIK
jgi:dUTP pyrophosphatase